MTTIKQLLPQVPRYFKANLPGDPRTGRASVFAEGGPLQEAAFPLEKFYTKIEGDPNAFIYITVTAADGSYATTRAYFIDEL